MRASKEVMNRMEIYKHIKKQGAELVKYHNLNALTSHDPQDTLIERLKAYTRELEKLIEREDWREIVETIESVILTSFQYKLGALQIIQEIKEEIKVPKATDQIDN